MSALPLLHAQKLTRFFPPKKVLDGVDLSLYPEERLALIGENGSGKTTLLRTLSTLSKKNSGEIHICGAEIEANLFQCRKNIGWAGTIDGGFVARFTGKENFFFFAALAGVSAKDATEIIEHWIDWPILAEALDTKFLNCSSGMRQSLNLVRSLLHRPQIIIWDEPFRSLSLEMRAFAQKRLLELPKIPAIVFSSHTKEDYTHWASRVVRLQNGKVEDVGSF